MIFLGGNFFEKMWSDAWGKIEKSEILMKKSEKKRKFSKNFIFFWSDAFPKKKQNF